MPDETVVPTPDPPAADAQGGGQNATDAGTGTAAAHLTREQDAIAAKARRDEADKRKAAEARLAEAEAQLAEYRSAEEARKQAEMSELEKAQAAAAAAEERAAAAEAARQAAEVGALRANLIASEAAALPAVYKQLVTGTDEASIKESIASAQAAFAADRETVLGSVLTLTPEQLADLGENGKALAERIQGRQNIGSPPAGGKAPSPGLTWDEGNRSPAAWAEKRKQMGIGASSLTSH